MQGELKVTVMPKKGDIDMELDVQCRLSGVSSYDKIALLLHLASVLEFTELEWMAMCALRAKHGEFGGMDVAQIDMGAIRKARGDQQ